MASDALRVPASVLDETIETLRQCGKGEYECVVFWVTDWAEPRLVIKSVHPEHHSDFAGYEIDKDWLQKFFLQLAKEKQGVLAQVHTHPQEAFHSPTDDAWPVVSSEGFLSLVIPDFAMRPQPLCGAYLTRITKEGTWSEVIDHADALRIGT
jgi:hypothetical protein